MIHDPCTWKLAPFLFWVLNNSLSKSARSLPYSGCGVSVPMPWLGRPGKKNREITRWFWGKFFYLACRKLDMFSDIFPGLKYQDNWGFRPAVQGNVLKTQQLIWGFAVFFVWKVCKAALSKGLTRCFGNRWWCFVSRGHSWHQINAELDATQIFICGRTTSWIYGHGFTRGWPSREWIHAPSDILMDFISWRLFKYAIWIFAGELDPNIDKSDLKCILYYILEKD